MRTRLTVLVVEDSDADRHRLVDLLVGAGHGVVEARNGRDGLALLRRAPIDAVLLDLFMPSGDAWELREAQLRDPRLARLPSIVMVPKRLESQVGKSLRLDMAAVLRRPFTDQDIASALADAFTLQGLIATVQPYRTPDGQPLYWSKRGQVACRAHAPSPGGEEWIAGLWAVLPMTAGKQRVAYQCQHCQDGPIRRRRVRRQS